MKRTLFCFHLITIAVLLLPALGFTQILNGGFEDWTGINPDNWYADNAQGLYVPVTKSNTSHSGSFALQGQVVNFLTTPVPPLIMAGSTANGFSVSQKYLSLEGYYQFSPVGGDALSILVTMLNQSNGIGLGTLEIQNSASSYTHFAVGIQYYNESLIPDTVKIEAIIAASGDVHVGSTFLFDDLTLTMNPTGVEKSPLSLPSKVILNQNYPNPFNPSTNIGFFLPTVSEVSLTVYDIRGQVVDKPIDRQNMSTGYHSIQWKPATLLPSGVYFYNLNAGSFSQTRRMLFIK